jgi:hypothetical protein
VRATDLEAAVHDVVVDRQRIGDTRVCEDQALLPFPVTTHFNRPTYLERAVPRRIICVRG